jgi:phosphoribosyl-dephospho-CoA transferase
VGAARQAWRRHQLVRVHPAAWPAALASVPRLRPGPLLAAWAARGLPLVVRRRMEGEPPGTVPLGLPLPLAEGRRRIALSIAESAIAGRLEPPLLAAVRNAVPACWLPTIAALRGLADQAGVEVRPFGSLMWQHLTGLPYLTPRSDLDLLWRVPADAPLAPLLAGIARIDEDSPMRLDGELVFADGGAVNWREMRDALARPGPAEVLVKTMDGVRLADAHGLVAAKAEA